MSLLTSPLRAIRRLVTGHTRDGKSTFLIDDNVPSAQWRDTLDKRSTRLWVTEQWPADNGPPRTDMKGVTPDREIVSSNGSHCICMEVGPGGRSHVHRTDSIDYVILISGQLTLVLENGEERTLTEPGSVIVQRGTMHAWENRSPDTWVRYVVVALDAAPLVVQGPDGQGRTLPEGIKKS